MDHWEAKSGNKIFLYVMCLSALALFLPRSVTDRLDHLAGGFLSPLCGGGRAVSLMVTEPLRGSGEDEAYVLLREQLARSEALNENLRQLIEQQSSIITELSKMPQEFGMSDAALVLTDIVGSDSSNSHRIKTLNQGSSDWGDCIVGGEIVLSSVGGEAGDVYEMGIIGRISGVGPWTSNLQLLNDRGFRMSVLIVPSLDRGGDWVARGVLKGNSDGTISVNMVQCEYDVLPGDVVLAESRADSLPVAMLVGWVSECELDDRTAVMWDISVRPAVDLNSASRVAIVDMDGENDTVVGH